MTFTIPGRVEAEAFTGFSGSTTSSKGGTGTYGNLQPCSDTSGCGQNVGWIGTGEWFSYDVNVQSSVASIEVRVASAYSGYFHLDVDDGAFTTASFNVATGGWQNWTTVTTSLSLATGSHLIKLIADTGGFNVNYLDFGSTPTGPGPLYNGCYSDDANRALDTFKGSRSDMTPQLCQSLCTGYHYAGVQCYSECWCGNAVGYDLRPDRECSMPCSGDSSQMCGGAWRNSLYFIPPYVGCYTDSSARALPVFKGYTSDMTPQKCEALCEGYNYAGVQWHGQCWCGNAIGHELRPDSECNAACNGDLTQVCGGDWHNSVYALVGAPPRYTLTVAKSGSGFGTVIGGGIDCGPTCSVTVGSGTSVSLTATAASGSSFTSWSGCDSTSGSSCTVGATSKRTVTANFELANAPAWNSPLAAVVDGTLKPSAGVYGASFRSSATLWAAQNEFELFHLVLFGPSSALSITLPGGTAPDGSPLALLTRWGSTDTIPRSEVKVFEERPVVFTQPSSIEAKAGAWPDALVPYGPHTEVGLRKNPDGTWEELQTTETRRDFPIGVDPGTTRSFLVEIHVPPGTPAGLYRGQVIVSATGPSFSTQIIPVDLHVRSFGLQSTSSLQNSVKMDLDHICKAHGDTGSGGWGAWCPDGEARHRWARLYARFLLDHRITSWLADTLLARADGSPDYETTEREFRRTYGPLMDGSDPYSRLVGAQMTTLVYPWFRAANWTQSLDSADVATAKLREWARFTRGILDWWPRTLFFTLDEPRWHAGGYPVAIQWASWAHSADPDYRVVLTGILPEYVQYTGSVASGTANIIATAIEGIDDRNPWMHGNQRPTYDPFVAVNPRNEVWAYQSCGIHGCDTSSDPTIYGYPLINVDSTAVQNRAQPWMHYIYRLSGLHYWGSVYQLYTAWDVDGTVFTTGNGDGNLLYPGTPTPVAGGSSQGIGGTTHIPLASTRVKIFRDGLEDYEYLRSCERLGGSAMSIARALFPMHSEAGAGPANETGSLYSATTWNPNTLSDDPTILAAALADRREELARCIGGAGDAAPLPFAPLVTRQIGTSAEEDSAQVAVADDGSAYLAGATTGAVTRASAGGQDVALWKLDANAVPIPWTQFGSAGNDVPRAVLPSHTEPGAVYVAGTTTGVLGSRSLGDPDGYLVRLEPGGNRAWTRQFGTSAADEVAGATIDSSGSIWVVYRTPSLGTSTLIKFTPAGALQGEFVLDGFPAPVVANAIVSDEWGDLWVGGTSGPDGTGAFVAKYNSAGSFGWKIPDGTRGVPAPFFGAVTSLALGPDWGLYVGGVNINLPSRNGRPALARIDPWSGIRSWVTTVGGTADLATVTALVSVGKSLYLAGYQQTQVVGQAAKGKDAFVIQFDTDGMRGGSSTVRTGDEEIFTGAVHWRTAGDLLLSGTTTGNVAGRLGNQDLFLQVLRPPPG